MMTSFFDQIVRFVSRLFCPKQIEHQAKRKEIEGRTGPRPGY